MASHLAPQRSAAFRGVVMLWVAVLFGLAAAGPARAESAADAPLVAAVAPVDGTLVGDFTTGAHYDAGRRGLEYQAVTGDVVRAPLSGRISRASEVGGTMWVVIDHADGTQSTMSGLAPNVSVGTVVTAGQIIGIVASAAKLAASATPHGRVFWAVRAIAKKVGGKVIYRYLDPKKLLDPPPLPTLVNEGSVALDGEILPSDFDDSYWVDGGEAIGRQPRDGTSARGPPTGFLPDGELPIGERESGAPGFTQAPNDNYLFVIEGIMTRTDEDLPFDVEGLGIADEDWSQFSYSDAREYGRVDTWASVADSAARLDRQLREVAAQNPGRPIDIVGHSLGGFVAMYWLTEYADRPGAPPIANLVTSHSPLEGHGGAPFGQFFIDHAVEGAEDFAERNPEYYAGPYDANGRPDLGDPFAIDNDLRPDSQAVQQIHDTVQDWNATGTGPINDGTRVITIAGNYDLVVPAGNAMMDGTPSARVDGGHLDSEEWSNTQVIWQHLAGANIEGDHRTTRITRNPWGGDPLADNPNRG